MLAMNYRGPYRVRAENMPDPAIEHPNDAIVRVLRSCICGSDLHLYHGLVPDTRVGTTFGHEFVGEVVELGSTVQNLKLGDRVIVPFNVFCGTCYFCQRELYGKLPQHQPASDGCGRHLRVLPHCRRLCGGSGAVCSRPVRRCRSDEDPE